jgi:3-deoxy-manno-octulosonate cytidylyltransferase (CMP-KDO synthetase)
MNIIGIIPARMDSSRFPGKPMKQILGMPMIEHCYRRLMLCDSINDCYVATCDEIIYEHIKKIGGKVVWTSKSHNRATTRTAEAIEKIRAKLKSTIDIVVMAQGDEPLLQPKEISIALNKFEDSNINIINIATKPHSLNAFLDKNNVKVVIDKKSNALYFSREPIPSPWKGWCKEYSYIQTGIIAFRNNSLEVFNSKLESPYEIIESIDMNRIIEDGEKIYMHVTDFETIGVDTHEDLIFAEELLKLDTVLIEYLSI